MNEVDTAFVVLEDGDTLTVPTALAGKVMNQIRVGYRLEGGKSRTEWSFGARR